MGAFALAWAPRNPLSLLARLPSGAGIALIAQSACASHRVRTHQRVNAVATGRRGVSQTCNLGGSRAAPCRWQRWSFGSSLRRAEGCRRRFAAHPAGVRQKAPPVPASPHG